MDSTATPRIVWAAVFLVFLFVVIRSTYQKRRGGGRRRSPGPGAYGAIYELLSQDKRNAIEMIVEEKAEARDPEDADGNRPDLQSPKRTR